MYKVESIGTTLALALVVAGCAHTLTLVSRSGGGVGKAEVTTYGIPNGHMVIYLNGKDYSGE